MNSSTTVVLFNLSWPIDKIIRILVLIMIMCLTLVGNLYTIIELFFRRHQRWKRFNSFILNLAVGDLAIFFCTMTSELLLLIYEQEWILGNFACKFTLYLQVVTIASTTFINLAMTYDRYKAICCPFRTCQSSNHISRVMALCWISSFLIPIPQLFIFERSLILGSSTRYRCASTGYTAEWQRQVYFTIFASYVLFIPVLCITIWYMRIIWVVRSSIKEWKGTVHRRRGRLLSVPITSFSNIRTTKLAMFIILGFIVCWTPYVTITMIQVYSEGRFRLPSYLDGVLQTLCLLQSALNPAIYMSFTRERKHTSTLILVAASTNSQAFTRRRRRWHHQQQRERGGTISFNFANENSYQKRKMILT